MKRLDTRLMLAVLQMAFLLVAVILWVTKSINDNTYHNCLFVWLGIEVSWVVASLTKGRP